MTKNNQRSGSDSMALILQEAGKSTDEILALSTLDDADMTAEDQFSGEAPTITSLFGTGLAHEFDAGKFSPSPEVASCMDNCLKFLEEHKKAGTLLDNEKMLFPQEIIDGLAAKGFFALAIPEAYEGKGAKLGLSLIHI